MPITGKETQEKVEDAPKQIESNTSNESLTNTNLLPNNFLDKWDDQHEFSLLSYILDDNYNEEKIPKELSVDSSLVVQPSVDEQDYKQYNFVSKDLCFGENQTHTTAQATSNLTTLQKIENILNPNLTHMPDKSESVLVQKLTSDKIDYKNLRASEYNTSEYYEIDKETDENKHIQNTKTFTDFDELLASSELKKYLPKKAYNNSIDPEYGYAEYLIKRKHINYYNLLNDKQKSLISQLGPEYFPKTLDPDFREFMFQQFAQISHKMMLGNVLDVKYIPVFIPLQCYISSENCKNSAFMNKQSLYTSQLKINYITTTNLYLNTQHNNPDRDNTEFMFTCSKPLEDMKEPEILVCIPDTFLNSKMEISRLFRRSNVRCFFYHAVYKFDQLKYCCYKIVINKKINNHFYRQNLSGPEMSQAEMKKLDVIEQFQDLKRRIKDCICQIQRTHFRRAALLSQNLEKIENDHILSKKPKLSTDSNDYASFNTSKILSSKMKAKKTAQQHNLFLNNEHAEIVFKDINEQINTKYDKEKGITYNSHDLLKHFDKSAFAEILDNDLFQEINNTFERDFNEDKSLIEPSWAMLLLPISYCNKTGDKDNNCSKIQKLVEQKVSRHYYVKLYKNRDVLDPIDGKVLVALTQKLPVADAMTDNQVIVLLPPQFDEKYKPLYDPNQFIIHPLYYSNVNKIKDVNYHLYEFYLDNNLNISTKSADFTRKGYIDTRSNIESMTLKEYLLESCYKFDIRAKKQALKLQQKIYLP